MTDSRDGAATKAAVSGAAPLAARVDAIEARLTAVEHQGFIRQALWQIGKFIFQFVNGEWILLGFARNSGGVVLFRSAWITLLCYASARALREYYIVRYSASHDLVDTIPWLGAIWGAAYFALHARFASQWAYLAGVYNQIKQTECQTKCNRDGVAMAEWKAAFIEDCAGLHLAGKPCFASAIRHWGATEEVRDAFKADRTDGAKHLDEILAIAARAERF
jgi:hypothetical protein